MDARGMVRKLVALAAVFTLTFAPVLVLAGEVIDGSVPGNGLPQAGDVGATWNGSMHKVLRSDAEGILRVTEEYPQSNQFALTSVASMQQVFWCKAAGLQPLGTVWTAYPYGQRILRMTTRRQPLATPSSAIVYVYTSEDGSTFMPLTIAKSFTASAGNFAAFGDSASTDTLKFLLPLRGTSGSSSLWSFAFSIPSSLYLGRYVQLYASKSDTTSGEVDSVLVSAAWAGREY